MAKKTAEAPKPAKGTTALANRPQRPVARTTGAKLSGKGFENLSREDILLPRILLLQAQSPQVMESDETPGTFFLNLGNKNIGAKITITPVLHYRSRIKWIPRDDGGGIDCSAQDARVPGSTKYAPDCASCEHKDWSNDPKKSKKEQAPECVLYENFVVLVGDSTEPVILSMSKSSGKVAKKFYSMAAVKGGNFFDYAYELTVAKDKNDKGQTYFNYVIKDTGKKTSEECRLVCDQLWASLSKIAIRTEMEHPEGGAAEPVSRAAPAAGDKY